MIYDTEFSISFYLSKVGTESMVELFKKLTFFKPTKFSISGYHLYKNKRETFYKVMSDPQLLEKHGIFHASPPRLGCGMIHLDYFSETGIVQIYGSSTTENSDNLYEISGILSRFSKDKDIVSASVRTGEEYFYYDWMDLKNVKKLHPEMTEIKTVGDKASLRADPEQFAAHTHEHEGIWFGCCYEMWFGRDYDKYIPLKKLKSFNECKLNETLDNDTVHIILYDAPDEFSTEISAERAWAFRKHTDCDSAAEFWEKRVHELAREAGHFTYEIEEGKFPHGGIRLFKTYLDENGKHVNKCDAVKVHIYEGGADGKPVFEEIVELKNTVDDKKT